MSARAKIISTVVCWTICVVPAGGWASVGLEGAEPFSFGAWLKNPPRLGQVGTMRLSMRGSYADTVVGEAHIGLPIGMELVSGDTLRRARPSSGAAEWVLQIRPTTLGRQEVRGFLRVNDVGGLVDEGEFVFPLEVRADTTIAGKSRLIRAEHVRGGQRYRYGGEYLVPIEGPEYVIQGDIHPGTGKPRVLERRAAIDSLGRLSPTTRIPFVVFIDPDGKVTEARPRGGADRDPYLIAIGRAALQHWRFAPATAKGRPVTDWLEVKVEVLPPK